MSRSLELARRAALIRQRIAGAGGDPDAITLVAVSKGRPVDDCRAAVAAGLGVLGENRVQEALQKAEEVPGARWHLIGHLQTNKVRLLGDRFELIQSVDSLRLAEEIALRLGSRQQVLLQVNISREPQKHGFAPEAAVAACREAVTLVDVRGLMGMAAAGGNPGTAFAELRGILGEAEQALGRRLPILSMGMSGDLEAAVRAGSTLVRVGRDLFGGG